MRAATAFALCAPAAFACEGQTGKVIFEDKFTDDSGGWPLSAPDGEIKNDSLLVRPNPRGADEKNTSYSAINLTFPAGDGDYCMEVSTVQKASDANPVMEVKSFKLTTGE